MLARFTAPELSPADARLVEEIGEQTAAAARALARPSPRKPAWWALPIAASVIVGSLALALWWTRTDPNLERGIAAYDAATREWRPSELRLASAPYAPQGNVRGAPSERLELLESAVELLRLAAEKHPTAASRHAYGRALIASNEPSAAIVQLELARDLSPRDPQILVDLAVARAAARDSAGAATDLDRALALEPRSAEALFNRMVLRARAGQVDAARDDARRYLDLDPSSPWADEARRLLAEVEAHST